MLVSKIKPCMSQYEFLFCETANGSLYQLWFLWRQISIWITVEILELIHDSMPNFAEGWRLLDTEPSLALPFDG